MSLLLALVLAACAPIAVGPPPMPLPAEARGEVGLHNSARLSQYPQELGPAIWFRRPTRGGNELYVLAGAALGIEIFPFAGVGCRRYLLESNQGDSLADRLDLGIELGAGAAWAHVAMPVSLRLGPSVWLTSQPSIGLNYFGLVHVPLGVSLRPREHVQVNAVLGSRLLSFLGNDSIHYWNVGMSFPF